MASCEDSGGRHGQPQIQIEGLKVLVVDDDPLCLKVVEQMLRRCKYEGKRIKFRLPR